MQCQSCKKNEATIHLTEISDGVRAEMHLCEHCAQEEGIAVKSQIPLNELLSSLLAAQPEGDEAAGGSEQKHSCPQCGLTLDEFRRDAVLGCPFDYDVFEKSLLPLIEKAHDGKTSHRGKVPSKVPVVMRKEMELMTLRQQLETAVTNEDYELAAELRDKIEHMK
ncbi:MAG: UvrB/UvrC motif-containing protein [Planctomycetota bacterium]|jgi:protein arginine kinase activator